MQKRLLAIVCSLILFASVSHVGIETAFGAIKEVKSVEVSILRPPSDRILMKVLTVGEPVFAFTVDLDNKTLLQKAPKHWSASSENGKIKFSTTERPVLPSKALVFKVKTASPVASLKWEASNKAGKTLGFGTELYFDTDFIRLQRPNMSALKRVVASTTWFSANICGIQSTDPEELANIAMARLNPFRDLISSFNPDILSLAKSSGFGTVAADGHTISDLQRFLDNHPPVDYPAKYLSFDMTLRDYTSSDVKMASSLIRDAGFKVAFSGPSAKPFIKDIASVADLIIYEDQPTLLLKDAGTFLSNVREASEDAKTVNPRIIFLVFLPVRSSFNCQYDLDTALSTAASLKTDPNVDGIILFNWANDDELAAVMRSLGR